MAVDGCDLLHVNLATSECSCCCNNNWQGHMTVYTALYAAYRALLQTAFSFLKRIRKPKGLSDLKDILSRWKPWIPPK